MGMLTLDTAFALDIVNDQVAPPWLQNPFGNAWLTAMGQGLDAIRYRSAQSQAIHMPGIGDPSADVYLGLDRQLSQGPGETSAQFEARLSGFAQFWQHAGTDWAVLQVAAAYVVGFNGATMPGMRIVSNNSCWSFYNAGATPQTTPPQYVRATNADWNWDGNLPIGNADPWIAPAAGPWWRYWLIIDSYTGFEFALNWASLGTGGLPLLGDATAQLGSLGFQNVPPSFFTGLRAAIAPVESGGAWLRWIIVNMLGTGVIPDLPGGFPAPTNPNGFWGLGYFISSGQYQSAIPQAIFPVPGVPRTPTGTGPNTVPNAQTTAAGYRILGGQYVSL